MTDDILKKPNNKAADGCKRSTKYYAQEMLQLWISGGHQPDITEWGYRKEDSN